MALMKFLIFVTSGDRKTRSTSLTTIACKHVDLINFILPASKTLLSKYLNTSRVYHQHIRLSQKF